jgi:hypothetical protein
MRLKSKLTRSWAARIRILSFGCPALILGLAPVEAGTVLTVDFSPGQSFQTMGSFIDESVTDPKFGSARGIVDATLGVLRATDASVPARDPNGHPSAGVLQVNTILADDYTFHSSNPGSTTIAVHLSADGIMVIPPLDAQRDANFGILTLAPGNGGIGTTSIGLTSDPSSVDATTTIVQPGSYSVSEISTFDVTFQGSLPQHQIFVMSLRAFGGASLDFSSTARVSFDLPKGTSVTSAGGFVQTASVPEPSSIVVLLCGLAIIAPGIRLCRGSFPHSRS